jgi:hypothetical protein
MAYAKKYESYEVRELLKSAEGNASPVTGAAAHSRGLHAQSLHGGEGVSKTDLVDRVDTTGLSKNQKKKVPSASSMFPNLIQQGAAATEALNSKTGQAGLKVFDTTAKGKLLRLVLTVANIKEAGFLPGTMAPTVTYAKKGDAPTAQSSATTGVTMVVDRDEIHSKIFIQTCVPMSATGVTSNWNVKEFPAKTDIASGT